MAKRKDIELEAGFDSFESSVSLETTKEKPTKKNMQFYGNVSIDEDIKDLIVVYDREFYENLTKGDIIEMGIKLLKEKIEFEKLSKKHKKAIEAFRLKRGRKS